MTKFVEYQHPSALIAWRPEYELRAETWSYNGSDEQHTWLHCNVRKFSPSIANRMRRDWEQWRPLFDRPLFVRTTSDNTKLHKFLKSYGFVFLGEIAPGDWVFVHYNTDNKGGNHGRRGEDDHHPDDQ